MTTEQLKVSGNKKNHNRLIYINAFVVGGVIMALEMVGSRFLTPFFGNSVFTWASIISMVLLALAIGYFVGGNLADKKPEAYYIAFIVLLASFFILSIPIYFEGLFKFIYKQIPDLRLGGFLGALSILFLPLFLLGIYSPYSVKLGLKYSNLPGKVSGTIYAVSTIGSIVGTLGVTFWLIPNIGSNSITLTLSFIAFLSAISLMIFHFNQTNESTKRKLLASISIILYLLFFIAIIYSSEIKTLLGLKNTKSKYIIEEVESNYNYIIIKQKGEYVSMSFSRYKSKYTESKINIFNDDELPVSYTQIMPVGLVYTSSPKNLLMIGLGGGMISKYIHKYMPELKITGVELDDKVVEMAKKYFKLSENNNYKIIVDDGRIFLNNQDKKYDIIMIDAYKGGYIPFHLCTKEFYTLSSKHLSEGGSVVLNLHSGSKLYPRIMTTLKSVFKNVDIYASKTKGNVAVVAYQSEKISQSNLEQSALALQSKYGFYYDLNELLQLKTSFKENNKLEILTDDFAPINYLNAIEINNAKK